MESEQIFEEYDVVKSHVGLFDFSMEGKIKIKGPGKIDFIEGIVSNDIKNLEENNGIYAAFLDRLGKVLSDCIIYRFKDFLLLNMSFVGKKNIIEKLKNEANLVKSEVEDVTLKYGLFSLQGPKSIELINEIINDKLELKNQYQFTIEKITIETNNKSNSINDNEIKNIENSSNANNEIEIIITKNKRTTEDGYDILVPSSYYKEFKQTILKVGKDFDLIEINNETYDILRLEAKIPLYSIDFDQTNILNEVTEKAVSYEKGCFLGQEIVARIKNLAHGLTTKKLMALEIEGDKAPEKNTKIMKDDKEIGFITSAAFSPKLNKIVALGFLNKGFYEKGLMVEVGNEREAGMVLEI